MKTDAEYKADYEADNQERDHRGELLWKVTNVNVLWEALGEPEYLMFECGTAEGPIIYAMRGTDGTPQLQVEGKAERRDQVAEEFVSAMEGLGSLNAERTAWTWKTDTWTRTETK